MHIGLLHPGEMGVSIGRALDENGYTVLCCGVGRSSVTQDRARTFQSCSTLEELVVQAGGIISVCPPAEALAQAQMIHNCGFGGLYVDANAVAPSTALKIQSLFKEQYVDGGIIGPPATRRGTTRLYLSGVQGGAVAQWFATGPLEAIDLGAGLTAASALKMAYAAYTKGASALLLAVNTLAEKGGVRDHLLGEWAISQPGLATRSEKAALGTSRKAWRFVGEMQEIAKTFAEQSLPDDFHLGAAEIYRRMDSLKNSPPSDIHQVMACLSADGDKQEHD